MTVADMTIFLSASTEGVTTNVITIKVDLRESTFSKAHSETWLRKNWPL